MSNNRIQSNKNLLTGHWNKHSAKQMRR